MGASKRAITSFVKSFAIGLVPSDITVTSVAPGWVDTEMSAPAYGGDAKERIARSIPIGRIATAMDVAEGEVPECERGVGAVRIGCRGIEGLRDQGRKSRRRRRVSMHPTRSARFAAVMRSSAEVSASRSTISR